MGSRVASPALFWQLTTVTDECFDAAIDRVIAGLEKKGLTIDAHERRVVAFHEAGARSYGTSPGQPGPR